MGILRKIERFKNSYFGQYVNGVKYYNWHFGSDWLGQFIRAKFPEKDWHKFSIVSVFGSPRTFWFHKDENKIFFTGENPDRYSKYKDHGLDHVKLSMGFDYLDADNYMRFPLWILYLFSPESRYEDIKNVIDNINAFHPAKKDFCSLICKHGGDDNLRGRIFEEVSKIDEVKCAGIFMHNDDRLWNEFENSKHNYLTNFQFSICPENSNREGYVTEKLFEAFKAGTVPIYWGSNNDPEPGLVNKDAIVFWDNGGDNTKALAKIADIHSSEKRYNEFASQPRMTAEMVDYVWSRFQEFEQRLKDIIK